MPNKNRWMKYVVAQHGASLLLLLLAVSACASDGPNGSSKELAGQTDPSVAGGREKEKPRYLLIYTTWRKCYECPNRTLAYCPLDPDCNVPMKGVTHIEWFDSPAGAINRMNGKTQEVYSITEGDLFNNAISLMRDAVTEENLIGLFKVFPLSTQKVKVGEYEAEEKVTVKVKRDKKEWKLK